MTTEQRNPDGTFKPGHEFSTGRPKGSRNKALMLLENTAQDAALDITNIVIQAAKSGDIAAAKLIMERVFPVRKNRVEIDLGELKDGADIWQALLENIAAMARGELSIEEAQGVRDLLESAIKNLPLSFGRRSKI